MGSIRAGMRKAHDIQAGNEKQLYTIQRKPGKHRHHRGGLSAKTPATRHTGRLYPLKRWDLFSSWTPQPTAKLCQQFLRLWACKRSLVCLKLYKAEMNRSSASVFPTDGSQQPNGPTTVCSCHDPTGPEPDSFFPSFIAPLTSLFASKGRTYIFETFPHR
ncbi:hypothetical protein HZ326_3191 [Fusarium oxysporum f. sp. albedinis]|nr:hypothetical protein HZ326_3191 [Fusarium oxysporum f. sp. albedinis]